MGTLGSQQDKPHNVLLAAEAMMYQRNGSQCGDVAEQLGAPCCRPQPGGSAFPVSGFVPKLQPLSNCSANNVYLVT